MISVLKDIWNATGTDDAIVQIGPYILRHNSFHYIRSTLSDEVSILCIVMYSLCQQKLVSVYSNSNLTKSV